MPTLLAVPNVSEGGDEAALARLGSAFGRGAVLLDRHTDADHGRTVFTLAGDAGGLTEALVSGAEAALETIDMSAYQGAHPAIGALDVCPLVWLDPADRDAARTEAVAVATQIGGLGLPVFLYGELAHEPGRAERAYFRNGGLSELWLRMESRRAAARLRARRAAPARRRDPGHRPPAARRLQRRARQRRPRGRPRGRRRPARGGRRAARGAGDRAGAGQRPRPGLDQRPRPAGGAAGAVVEEVRGLAAPLGARPVEAELVGLIPAAALRGLSRRTCRSAASTRPST